LSSCEWAKESDSRSQGENRGEEGGEGLTKTTRKDSGTCGSGTILSGEVESRGMGNERRIQGGRAFFFLAQISYTTTENRFVCVLCTGWGRGRGRERGGGEVSRRRKRSRERRWVLELNGSQEDLVWLKE